MSTPLFMTALRAGLRLGELLGLVWGDVDVRDHFVTVRRSRSGGKVNHAQERQVTPR
jgi:integrase